MKEQNNKISLAIVNVELLEAGLVAQASFDEDGGNVGSSPSANWHLRTRSGKINLQHFTITFIDGEFCIQDTSGATYINSSSMPVGLDNYVRLTNDDFLNVGEYKIQVFINKDQKDNSINECWDEFSFKEASGLLDAELDDDPLPIDVSNQDAENLDPLAFIVTDEKSTSKLLLSEADENSSFLLEPDGDVSIELKNTTLQADSENDIASAIILKSPTETKTAIESKTQDKNMHKLNNDDKKEVFSMDDDLLDLLEEEAMKNFSENDGTVKKTEKNESNLPTAPMLNGLGVSVDNVDTLYQEVGAALQSCIQGLLALDKQVKESRYGLSNKNLQPIEDNPLRLGLSYEETISTLFDAKENVVQLSATSAVEESFKTILIHNEAVQYSANKALEKILEALSPEVLLKRFSRYRRERSTHADDKAWAWSMYESYYQELTSNRQQGFEKLFWEIFEQSYDQKIRSEHMESE